MTSTPAATLSPRDQRELNEVQSKEALRAFLPTQVAWDRGGRELATEAVRTHGVSALHHVAEMGRWIAYAKEQLDHGDYYAWLAQVGVDRTFAHRAVGVAVRLSKLELGATSPYKAFALLGLSDEQLAELEANGVVGALRLDDIETMTVAELRDEVGKLRAATHKGKEQLKAEREKTAELRDQVEALTDLAAKRKQEAEAAKELAERTLAIRGTLHDLRRFLREGHIAPNEAVSTVLIDMFRDLNTLREEFPELFHAMLVRSGVAPDAPDDDAAPRTPGQEGA